MSKFNLPTGPSWLQMLREGAEAARKATAGDPWEPTLRKLKGRVAHDGVERVATNDVFRCPRSPHATAGKFDRAPVAGHAPSRLDQHPCAGAQSRQLSGSSAWLRTRGAGASGDTTDAERVLGRAWRSRWFRHVTGTAGGYRDSARRIGDQRILRHPTLRVLVL